MSAVVHEDEFVDLKCPVTKGHPVNREVILNHTEDGKAVQATWECFDKEGGEFEFEFLFELTELIYFVEGEVTIEIVGGETTTYKAGDSAMIPKGTKTIFRGNQYVKKVLVLVSDEEISL